VRCPKGQFKACIQNKCRFTNPAFDARITFMKLAAGILIVIASAIFAGGQQRPLITDDVDITPPGSLEISAGVDFLQNAKFPLSG
jgi:hypothetical protein